MAGILLSLGAGMAGGVLSSALPLGALGNMASGFWNKLFTNQRLEPPTLIKLRLWGVLEHTPYLEQMAANGYDEGRSNSLLASNANWLDPGSILRAGWREGKPDNEIATDLVNHGWIPEEADRFITANRYYPGPADLVNWLAKEVFEENMVAKYGLTDELVNIDRAPFYKAGMDDEQIDNYWKAHWNHPAYTQVLQMMHREQLEEKDVREWFRLMEVPPYWRDKMIATSYKPYTRVDVRRMHKIGILTDEQLKRAYMDLGYNSEKADGMVAFTLKYNQEVGEDADLDLTRSMLEKAYRLGMLSPNEFRQYLEEMGYDEDKAEFIASIVDQDVSLDRAFDWISLLRNQVGAGLITVQEAGTRLSNMGLSDDAVQHYEVIFASYVEEPNKIPGKGDIKAWVKGDYIEMEEAAKYMKALGYGPIEIDLFLKTWSEASERYEKWVAFMRSV